MMEIRGLFPPVPLPMPADRALRRAPRDAHAPHPWFPHTSLSHEGSFLMVGTSPTNTTPENTRGNFNSKNKNRTEN